MFTNGSVKVMGVCFAFSSLVIGYIGMSLRNEADKIWIFMVVLSAIFGVIAAACLVEAGRAITGRITAAIAFVICAVICVASVNAAFHGEKVEFEAGDHIVTVQWWSYGRVFFFALMTLTAGYYTLHGQFPENWTFDELLRRPSFFPTKRKSKSTKRSKPKRRVRSLED